MGETYYSCTHSYLRKEHFGDLFAFTCNGCRELGYGTCYTCTNSSCNYHLHSACQSASPTMSHPFFKQGQFVLDKSMLPPPPPPHNPNPNHNHNHHRGLCVACGTSVHGWRYVLASTSGYVNNNNAVFLHPCCMTLPHQNLHNGKLERVINCVHCQSTAVSNEEIKGWAYVTQGFTVHVKCMKDVLHKDWERRYYAYSPQHGQTSYGGTTTTTQQRDLGRGDQDRGTRRKRDYFFKGLGLVANVFGILSGLGFSDLGSIMEELLELASNIW